MFIFDDLYVFYLGDYLLKFVFYCFVETKIFKFQRVRGSIPDGVVNFHLKIFNLRARRGGDVHFLIARLYITGLD